MCCPSHGGVTNASRISHSAPAKLAIPRFSHRPPEQRSSVQGFRSSQSASVRQAGSVVVVVVDGSGALNSQSKLVCSTRTSSTYQPSNATLGSDTNLKRICTAGDPANAERSRRTSLKAGSTAGSSEASTVWVTNPSAEAETTAESQQTSRAR